MLGEDCEHGMTSLRRITPPFSGARRTRQQSKTPLIRASAATACSSKPLRGSVSSPR